MIFLDAILACGLVLGLSFALSRVSQDALEKHLNETQFYKEQDRWKKWNSPG